VEQRLEVAMAMGADQVIKVDTKDTQKLANQIREKMGEAPNMSIECTGVEASVATAIYVGVLNVIRLLLPCVARQLGQEVWWYSLDLVLLW